MVNRARNPRAVAPKGHRIRCDWDGWTPYFDAVSGIWFALHGEMNTSAFRGTERGRANGMKRFVTTLLAALVLLAPLGGFAAAQVILRGPQAGGLSGASVSGATPRPGEVSGQNPLAAEPKSLAGMLAAQNDARARLGLPSLTWSADLAAKAEATAKAAAAGLCTVSSAAKAGKAASASVYWSAAIRRLGGDASPQEIPASYVVSQWREGRNGYDLASGACRANGSSCEPYARMVAPKAKIVGCARAICPSQAQIWACHYSE